MPALIFNLDTIHGRVHAILRRSWWRRFSGLFLPLVTHIASVTSIFIVWFTRGGSFNFDILSFKDWIICFVAAALTFGGIHLIRKALPLTSEMLVSRGDLSILLTAARAEATISIHIVAGDLSWLIDDLDSLLAIKSKKQSLRLYIH